MKRFIADVPRRPDAELRWNSEGRGLASGARLQDGGRVLALLNRYVGTALLNISSRASDSRWSGLSKAAVVGPMGTAVPLTAPGRRRRNLEVSLSPQYF